MAKRQFQKKDFYANLAEFHQEIKDSLGGANSFFAKVAIGQYCHFYMGKPIKKLYNRDTNETRYCYHDTTDGICHYLTLKDCKQSIKMWRVALFNAGLLANWEF